MSDSHFSVRGLTPQNSIVFVGKDGIRKLEKDAISYDLVGQKAYGLASLPAKWTLPFIAISSDLFREFVKNPSDAPIETLASHIKNALILIGIENECPIIVRSSGCSEGMSKRGKFYSSRGYANSLLPAIRECLDILAGDAHVHEEEIPILVQRYSQPEAKGHLSNERRCYEEYRDWMGEIQFSGGSVSAPFQINLRNWRQSIDASAATETELLCALSARVCETLKTPAKWAYDQGVRVHFEWVWDGANAFIVQADEEISIDGYDPHEQLKERSYSAVNFLPKVLVPVTKSHAEMFAKIRNVFIYLDLNLPITQLYILEDRKTIEALSLGQIDTGLRSDLSALLAGALIIRSDVDNPDLRARQLLPRTEVRDLQTAVDWLAAQSKILLTAHHGFKVAFIFHNFIPSLSSAFAYAAPNERNVQIEALWGLPEGLYYNSHDKYIVDTGKRNTDKIILSDISKFKVRERRNFKRFFVSADSEGRWKTLTLKAPYDWRGSLTPQWCKQMAYESRRIADLEGRAVSIMWFTGLMEGISNSEVIPWYHEPFDALTRPRAITARKKTAFDRSITIATIQDLEALQSDADSRKEVKRIRIQPSDEELLRDKNTLRKIGELARYLGATIILEGAVLSHAYYQLLDTKAIVEVVHPFIGFDEKHEFRKLVRDGVPKAIEDQGELAFVARISDESIIRALREKLIEESFELLDAPDLDSIISEMADAQEILDELRYRLNIQKEEVDERQSQKKKSRGGFKNGLILLETRNPPPTAKIPEEVTGLFNAATPQNEEHSLLTDTEFQHLSETADKWTDRRHHDGETEVIVHLQMPITRQGFSSATTEERVPGSGGKTVKASVKSRRVQSKWEIELSIHISASQLEFLFADF